MKGSLFHTENSSKNCVQIMHYQQQQNYCIIITAGTKDNMPFTVTLKISKTNSVVNVEVKDRNIFLFRQKKSCERPKRDRLRFS